MAEFGENLKKVREEKGITQQTLADHLYVTRQAISRWEGGSRFPDLMTAKKMAQYLEVSLDDLLSDDDMKTYAQNSVIMDTTVAKGVQLMILALAFMCTLIQIIQGTALYVIRDDNYMVSFGFDGIRNIIMMLIMAYGIWACLKDKLTSMVAMWLAIVVGATDIMGGISLIFAQHFEGHLTYICLAIAVNLIMIVVCVRFFKGKRRVSPLSVYVLSAVLSLYTLCTFVLNFNQDIPVDIKREIITMDMVGVFQVLLFFSLLSVMAYNVDRKRKLAARM